MATYAYTPHVFPPMIYDAHSDYFYGFLREWSVVQARWNKRQGTTDCTIRYDSRRNGGQWE